MIAKINKYIFFIAAFAFLSCKKQDDNSDLTFSQTCDFSGSNIEVIQKLDGTLSYTNNIMDIPPSELPPNADHVFLIRSPGRLQMVVCNMPSDFKMAEGESKNITFSGRAAVFSNGINPSEIDATNTWVELKYLKFQ